MEHKYQTLKLGCYTVNISMSVVGNLPPLLFLTFRSLYGLSYSQLGMLVFIGFFAQLLIDLVFSFFSHKFDIPKTVKFTPVLTFVGLILYILSPVIFPDHVYIGLVIGTLVFASASGLAEVLISPVIAAIPSDNPDREMSKLHSVYTWGVVGVILISTVFILLLGSENWQWLVCIFLIVPTLSIILFSQTQIPEMETPEKVSGVLSMLKNKSVWLCVSAIFLGGASECTMAQWASGYLEQALGIPKVMGDIFGVAMFAVMLGTGRSLYAKTGKNISRVMFFCGVGATICYFTAALTPLPILGLFACAFTGFCTSMLWPGSLIVASERVKTGGVFIYALMAAGGDLGASIGPQLIGIITDTAINMQSVSSLAQQWGLSPDQLGMKIGMLSVMLFPLISIFVYLHIRKTNKNQ